MTTTWISFAPTQLLETNSCWYPSSERNTADLEHHIQLLTPLIITPLPSDIKPEQAMTIMWNTGARITSVIPDFVDTMAVVLYVNGPGAVSTEVEGFINAYAGELPTPAVVAQFFDPVTETDQQKWLLGFDTTPAVAKFLANKGGSA
jgi:hypothetical protein